MDKLPEHKPMLCHRYKTHFNRLSWPCYIQPKLNGIRAIYHSEADVFQSHSRRTKEVCHWNPPVLAHIREQLQGLFNQNVILDGELYVHGWPLQRINGAASVNRIAPANNTNQIQFWVFDLVADVPFEQRYQALQQLKQVYPHVVETHHVMSPSAADHFYNAWKKQGYEGMIYRNPHNTYGFIDRCTNQENRWSYMIKRKDRSSSEYEIVGITEETSLTGVAKQRTGALELVTSNGQRFTAGSGLNTEQREAFWTTPPVGRMATISFEMLSEGGIPLQPVVEFVHDE